MSLIEVVLAAALTLVPSHPTPHGRIYQILHSPGPYVGDGEPWVLQLPEKYVMFRCRNSDNHDRIWRSESRDGIHGWTEGESVLSGEYFAQDDLSCAPGVVIAPDGLWHMYYITAARQTMCSVVEMWHATSTDEGHSWTKLGKVWAVPTSDCSLLEPSPVIEDGKIAVYFVVNWYGPVRLFRMDSWDGHNFTSPSPVGDVPLTCNARYSNGVLAYANSVDGCRTVATQLFVARGLAPGESVVTAGPGLPYSRCVEPGNFLPGPPARLYFAASDDPQSFSNSINVIVYR